MNTLSHSHGPEQPAKGVLNLQELLSQSELTTYLRAVGANDEFLQAAKEGLQNFRVATELDVEKAIKRCHTAFTEEHLTACDDEDWMDSTVVNPCDPEAATELDIIMMLPRLASEIGDDKLKLLHHELLVTLGFLSFFPPSCDPFSPKDSALVSTIEFTTCFLLAMRLDESSPYNQDLAKLLLHRAEHALTSTPSAMINDSLGIRLASELSKASWSHALSTLQNILGSIAVNGPRLSITIANEHPSLYDNGEAYLDKLFGQDVDYQGRLLSEASLKSSLKLTHDLLIQCTIDPQDKPQAVRKTWEEPIEQVLTYCATKSQPTLVVATRINALAAETDTPTSLSALPPESMAANFIEALLAEADRSKQFGEIQVSIAIFYELKEVLKFLYTELSQDSIKMPTGADSEIIDKYLTGVLNDYLRSDSELFLN
ncbi:MAG: hypothetical protein KDD62_12965, partial [Bdellovibrionales bacterium]|nr:hypothetical protein [Bdellovibrionales bacterium]